MQNSYLELANKGQNSLAKCIIAVLIILFRSASFNAGRIDIPATPDTGWTPADGVLTFRSKSA
jgi:hypothetical protein